MSQAKVDRYKEEKANRKKIMRKEKIANRLRKCAVAVVAAALVVCPFKQSSLTNKPIRWPFAARRFHVGG